MGEAEVLLMASPQFLSLGPCFPHLTSGSSLPLQQSVQGELAGKGHCKFFPIRAAPSGSLGQLAPRGAKLICVSKHPPPPKEKPLLSLSGSCWNAALWVRVFSLALAVLSCPLIS